MDNNGVTIRILMFPSLLNGTNLRLYIKMIPNVRKVGYNIKEKHLEVEA